MSRSAACLALAAVLLGPGSARALTLASDSIPVSWLGMVGTIEIVSFGQGAPAGATPLAGAVAETDWVMAFRIALAPESAAILGPDAFATDPTFEGRDLTGGGTVPGPGVSVTSASVSAGSLFSTLDFAWEAGTLDPGETSDVLYAAWSDLAPGDRVGVLLGKPVPPGQPFGRRDSFSTTVVPEPAPGALLALGLLAAALQRRRPT